MPSGTYMQVDVMCPFYKTDGNRPSFIQCEGINDKNVISIKFSKLEYKNKYMLDFCIRNYCGCKIYKVVNEQYEEENND